MKIAESIYRSPLGWIMSIFARFIAKIHQPFMVYGYRDPKTDIFRKWTRISSSAIIMNKQNLVIEDHVWVWHYSILDATEGLIIEEGVQIGAWVGIFTHGSESAIRLLGRHFVHVPNEERIGYTRGSIRIGAYTFIGAGSTILPSVNIGKGCIIGAGTLIADDVPDYSIVTGIPGKIKGSTIDLDVKFIKKIDCSLNYYDSIALNEVLDKYNKINT